MRLYLSSYRIPVPEELFKLFNKKPEDIKVALIPNAKDYYADRARNFKIQSSVISFNEIGIKNVEVVDLKTCKNEELLNKLKNFDLVWVIGGNTFCLMQEIVKSGFGDIIKNLIDNGTVYGGESAGAIVAGNSLSGVEFADEPEFAEDVYWDGMKLIDKIIVPHVDSQFFGAGVEELINLHSKDKNLIKLTDYQALIVDKEVFEIIG